MTATDSLRPKFDRIQRNSLIVGIVALIAIIIGLFFNPAQFFESYLWAYMFWSGLTLGCLGIYLIQNVTGGNWGVVIRRILEAGTRTLPIAGIGIIPIFLGMHFIYSWTNPVLMAATGDVGIKKGYLNIAFFIVRTIFYFIVWCVWGYRLLAWSDEQERVGDPDRVIQNRMKRFSAPGIVIYGYSTAWAFIDWIMSLEPNWYSTVYPWMFTCGQLLLTFAFVIAVLILMANYAPFKGIINFQHYNDLGNMMLCFTMLWAYTSVSQLIIVWSENLPTEIPWYIRRFSNGWGYIAFTIAILHFFVPFVLLLMRFIKRNPKLLFGMCILIIAIRIVDVFWIVMPAFRQHYLSVTWMDVVAAIALGGIWIAFFIWHLKSRPLLPFNDPRLGYHTLESEA